MRASIVTLLNELPPDAVHLPTDLLIRLLRRTHTSPHRRPFFPVLATRLQLSPWAHRGLASRRKKFWMKRVTMIWEASE